MAVASTTLLPLSGRDIDGLTNGSYWQLDASRTLTWSVADNPSVRWLDPNFTAAAIAPALATIEAVTNIRFVYAGYNSDVRAAGSDLAFTPGGSIFPGDTAEALGFFPNINLTNNLLANYGLTRASYPNADGDIWFNSSFSAQAIAAHDPGSQIFQTVIHEVGHTLGLKHPHDDGSTGHPTFTQEGVGAYDSNYFTVMSYNPPPGSSPAHGYLATPGVLDIVALQSIYGANPTTAAGDTVWRFVDDGAGRSIYDVSGTDTLDTSNMIAPMSISLIAGNGTGRLDGSGLSFEAIAFGSVIENAIGGGGSDNIVGNDVANTVAGLGGNDTLYGLGGDDVLYGNQGTDVLFGNQGGDTLFGGQGEDTVYGGQGADLVTGNLGNDLLFGNIGVDLLYGGQGNDVLYGGQGDDVLSGDLGNDILSGDLGADRFVFGVNSGNDLILGFNQADGDRLSLSGQAYTVVMAADGFALLTMSGGGTVELAGVTQGQIGASYFA